MDEGVCVCTSPCSLLRFPDGAFSAHVSELPLNRQGAFTDCNSFFDLLSQTYTWKFNTVF